MPTRPALLAEYAIRFFSPSTPAIEAMLTIRPSPAAVIRRTAAWLQMNVPVRLTSSVRRQASRGWSRKLAWWRTPALLTR
jgi:hypothetical protein